MRPAYVASIGGVAGSLRVGFDRSFGVKLQGYRAVQSGLPSVSRGSKLLKQLRKMSEKGEAPKVMYITLTDPERV